MEAKAFFSVGCVKQTEVAFHDRVRVVGPRDPMWGGDESLTYRSKIMVNPTWRQLLRCLNSQMKKTRDFHHCFLEGAHIVRRERDKHGVSYAVVRLETGS